MIKRALVAALVWLCLADLAFAQAQANIQINPGTPNQLNLITGATPFALGTFPTAGPFTPYANQLTKTVTTAYTVAAADRGYLITFNSASALAVGLSPTLYAAGFEVDVVNIGAGTVTVTPASGLINGQTSVSFGQGSGGHIVYDGTNFAANLGVQASFSGCSLFTTSAQGCVPASGTASRQIYLNAAGVWQSLAGPLVDAVAACNIDNSGATDVTAAINTCFSSHPQLAFRAGTYQISGCVNIPISYGALVGAGMGSTIFSLTGTTTSGICVADGGAYVHLADFQVKGSGGTFTAGCGIQTGANTFGKGIFERVEVNNVFNGICLGPTDSSFCYYCISEQNYGSGFTLNGTYASVGGVNTLTLQWGLIFSLAQENEGWGVYFTGPTNTVGTANIIQGTPWVSMQTFANNSGGICYCAPTGAQINDIALYDAVMSSNNYNNVVIASNNGQNHIIKGGLFELAGQTTAGRNVAHAASGQGSGIQFDSYDITISHADIQANSWHGITDNGSAGIVMGSFIGNKINGNSKATSNLDSGISLANSTAIYMAVGNMEYDAATQRQGITAQNASNVSVTSNYMTGVTTGCNAITGTFKGSGNFGTGCP